MMECMEKDWNMMEKRLIIGFCLMAGMLFGFLMAPVKKKVYCGNYNGSKQVADDGND